MQHKTPLISKSAHETVNGKDHYKQKVQVSDTTMMLKDCMPVTKPFYNYRLAEMKKPVYLKKIK